MNDLGSVVIREGRIRDFASLVRVACAVAKKKEKTDQNVKIKEIVFFPRTQVYVALYEIPASSRRMASLGVQGRKGSEK